jgi:pimeloyl-ACP methyl ester carboxylesterase
MDQGRITRRDVVAAGGAGVGLSVLPALASPANAAPTRSSADVPSNEIWAQEYWVNKGPVRLNLWRKRAFAPGDKEPPLPVLFLVHGSSLSARSSFDLAVPGPVDYSMMNAFARYGYDVWTMDHDGYGYSGSSGNNSDIASGVADLKAAVPLVLQETRQSKIGLFGESSGAIRAGAYAQSAPAQIERLVLAAFTYKGTGAAEIGRRQQRIAELKSSPRRKRNAGMIESIFSRDGHPGIYDPAVAKALVAAELKFGDTIPSGTYVDMAENLPLVDPTKIASPVLMTRGEWDGNSTDEDLLDFFRQLPNGDRQYVILPNTAHSQGFSKNHLLMWYVIKNFLAEPATVTG